jgi:hypothetical protein
LTLQVLKQTATYAYRCYYWFARERRRERFGEIAGGEMRVTLDCGRTVVVEGVLRNDTYAGVLEPIGIERLNSSILEKAKDRVDHLWKPPAIHLAPPVLVSRENAPARLAALIGKEEQWLPPIEMAAHATCYERDLPGDLDASCLAVIWYRGSWGVESLGEVVREGIRSVPWDELAGPAWWC